MASLPNRVAMSGNARTRRASGGASDGGDAGVAVAARASTLLLHRRLGFTFRVQGLLRGALDARARGVTLGRSRKEFHLEIFCSNERASPGYQCRRVGGHKVCDTQRTAPATV